jgi:hypothetical protein
MNVWGLGHAFLLIQLKSYCGGGGMLKVQPLFKVNLVDDKGKHVVLRKH